MSNNYQNWEDDEDFDMEEDEQPTRRNADNPTDLVKQLRKQLKMEQKRAKELEQKVSEFSSKERQSVISKVLEERGVNPKVAKLIPSDVDASDAAALNAWLEEYGDAFGIQMTEQPSQNLEGLKRINSATASASADVPANDFDAAMARIQTEDELYEYLQSLG